jgi:hypothetical protein
MVPTHLFEQRSFKTRDVAVAGRRFQPVELGNFQNHLPPKKTEQIHSRISPLLISHYLPSKLDHLPHSQPLVSLVVCDPGGFGGGRPGDPGAGGR